MPFALWKGDSEAFLGQKTEQLEACMHTHPLQEVGIINVIWPSDCPVKFVIPGLGQGGGHSCAAYKQ